MVAFATFNQCATLLLIFAASKSFAFQAPLFQLGTASYLDSVEKASGDRTSTVGNNIGGPSTPGADPYELDDKTYSLCHRIFPEYARDDGYVHSLDAGYFFSMSGADIGLLRHVWAMADGSDGPPDDKLNEWEFTVAMHLIACITRKGMAVPSSLPPSLRRGHENERTKMPTDIATNIRNGPQGQYREYQEKIQQPYQMPAKPAADVRNGPQDQYREYQNKIQQQYRMKMQKSQTHEVQPQLQQQTQQTSASQSIPMNTPARESLPDNMHLEAMPGKGLGVITDVQIAKGALVGDYKGEVMTLEEKDRRYLESLSHLRTEEDQAWLQSRLDRGQTATGTYLYGIAIPDPRHGVGKPKGHIFVDAEDEYCSLWTRFINHASPPNDNLKPQSLHVGWDGNPRVWFTAKRDIEAGEELTFNYGEDYWLESDNVV